MLSGKGGVGKSTVAVNLAMALMLSGRKVGLLDVDIHGPSVPTMLGLEGASVQAVGEEFLPVEAGGLKVFSLGFLLRNPDDAVIWRGPMKMKAIKQFLQDVASRAGCSGRWSRCSSRSHCGRSSGGWTSSRWPTASWFRRSTYRSSSPRSRAW